MKKYTVLIEEAVQIEQSTCTELPMDCLLCERVSATLLYIE